MVIDFQKEGETYVARFSVNNDFNIHLEFSKGGRVLVSQKTSGNEYAFVSSFNSVVVDSDFDGIVWPKQVQVISENYPMLAIVTEL